MHLTNINIHFLMRLMIIILKSPSVQFVLELWSFEVNLISQQILTAHRQRWKKRQAWQACLCYFFSQTVLIFGILTRSTCATVNLLNINMQNVCNWAICGLCICAACPDSTVSASAIDTDGTRTLSWTQNVKRLK